MASRLQGGIGQSRAKIADSSSSTPSRDDKLEPSESQQSLKRKDMSVGETTEYDVDNYKRFLSKLFVANKLSAKDVQQSSLFSSKAGAGGVASYGASGKSGRWEGNTHRDLKRKFKKDSSMPLPYYANIPTHNPDTQENRCLMLIPVLLLHEVIWW